MAKTLNLHAEPPLRGRHFIVEWAEKAELTQAEIARRLDLDPSIVSRWFTGKVPRPARLANLAIVLGADDPLALFRHPDDDWLAQFFKDRDQDEKRRAKQMLEAAFPRKRA